MSLEMSNITTRRGPPDHDDKLDSQHLDDVVDDNKVDNLAGTDTFLTSAFAGRPKARLLRTFWRLCLTGLAVASGGMYAGYTNAIPGSIVANRGFIDQFGTVMNAATGRIELDAKYVSLWGGMSFVAQIVFQLLSPITGDRFGLRVNMWIFTVAKIIAIILNIVATNWQVYLVVKFMQGMSTAYIGTSIMPYLSEIALPGIRGTMLSSFSLFFALSQLFSAIALQVLSVPAPLEFRRAFYSEFVMVGVWLCPLLYIPESPVFLCKKDNDEKAKRALKRLIGKVEGYVNEHEYACLKQEVRISEDANRRNGHISWKALLRRQNLLRCLISTLPFTYQNFVGVPLVLGNTTYFFQLAGLADPFLANMIVYIILIVGICSSFYFVERIGRRPLVLYGGIVMALLDLAIGGLGGASTTISRQAGSGLIALCCVWTLIYSGSLAPIGWISIVEVSTPALRNKTAAVATALQSMSGVLFSYTVPLMLSPQYAGWGVRIGFFFGGIALLYAIPIFFLFPETKGRTFGEIDELFERGIKARHFAKTKTSVQEQSESQQDRV